MKTITQLLRRSSPLVVAVLLLLPRSGLAQSIYEPYVISTLAGSPGATGSTDGPGNMARFYYPSGVAVDAAGNVYVGDRFNDTIRKITSAGVVSTFAGSPQAVGSADGTGNAARFRFPTGVAVDGEGNVYVADTANHNIRKITSSGVVTTLAGLAQTPGSADGTGSAARFSAPNGVAVDSAFNVYVADTGNTTIRQITPDGVVTTLAGLAGAVGSADGTGSAARFQYPQDVATDSAGNVYVADTQNQTIRQITSGGVVTTLAGLVGVSGSADGTGNAARFSNPTGVAADSAGNVYVVDYGNDLIRKLTPGGIVRTLAGLVNFAGSANGAGSVARFNIPVGVAVDSTGRIYVADSGNHTIRAGAPKLALVIAVSRKTHADSGSFDIDLPFSGSTGVECRAGGDHTIIIAFNNPVVSGDATITSGVGSVAGAPTFSGDTMTVNLTGVANAQTVTVTLSNVTDSSSQVYPDVPLSAGFLRGDANGNRSVNASDASQTKARIGQTLDATNFRSDVNANGSINAGDAAQVKASIGTALP